MKLNIALRLLLLSAALSSVASMACGNVGEATGGSSGTGGAPNPQYPLCTLSGSVFTGTLDGEPLDVAAQTHLIAFDQGANPPTVDVSFDQAGDLILHWSDLVEYGKPKGVIGTLLLPGEASTKHDVLPGSTMTLQDSFYYRFELLLNNGHLFACAYSK